MFYKFIATTCRQNTFRNNIMLHYALFFTFHFQVSYLLLILTILNYNQVISAQSSLWKQSILKDSVLYICIQIEIRFQRDIEKNLRLTENYGCPILSVFPMTLKKASAFSTINHPSLCKSFSMVWFVSCPFFVALFAAPDAYKDKI